MMARLVSWLHKNHKAFLIGVAISVAVSFVFIRKLEIKGGFEDLLPPSSKAVQILKRIPEKVGAINYVKIAITNDGKHLKEATQFADAYVAKLREYNELIYIKHRYDNQFFKDHSLQYLDINDLSDTRNQIRDRIDYEKRKNNPFLFTLEEEAPPLSFEDLEKKYTTRDEFRHDGYMVTGDQQVLFILARPKGFAANIPYSKKLLATMRAMAEELKPKSFHPSLDVHLLGPYYSNALEYEALINDVFSTSSVTLLILIVLFYLYYRSFRAIAYIIVAPVVGVIWSFALTYFAVGEVNTQTAFLAAILLGLVVDYSILLTSRYYEERISGKSIESALTIALSNTGMAVVLAGTTTLLSFASLIFSELVGFYQFGIIAAIGIAVSIVANITIVPALIFLIDNPDINKAKLPTSHNFFHYFGLLVDRINPNPKVQRAIIALGVVIVLGGAAAIPFIRFEYNLENLRSRIDDQGPLTSRLEEVMKRGTTPSVIFLTNGLEEVKEVSQKLTELERNPKTTIREHRSVYTLIPHDLDQKMVIIKEIRDLVSSGEKYLKLAGKSTSSLTDFKRSLNSPPLRMESIPEDLLVEFRDKQGELGGFVLVFPKFEQTDMAQMMLHGAEVRSIRGSSGRTYDSSGESIIFSDMLKMMKRDATRAIALTIIVVFIFMLIHTRSLKASLVCLSPLLLTLCGLSAFMVAFDVKLNFFNIIMFPLIIGICDDNSIQIWERFKEQGKTDVRGVVRALARALFMTNLTNVIGFGSMLKSRNMALNSMGLVAIVGIGLAWLTVVTFLPALLAWIYGGKEAKGEALAVNR